LQLLQQLKVRRKQKLGEVRGSQQWGKWAENLRNLWINCPMRSLRREGRMHLHTGTPPIGAGAR